MKFKRLTFKFKEPLTKIIHYQNQDVTQEQILETDVNGIRAKVKKELDRVLRSINMIRVLNPAMFDLMKFYVMGLELKFEQMVCFKKISPTEYQFIYSNDANALLTVREIAEKLGPLKKLVGDRLKDKDLQLVQILREKELISAFENYSFREMLLQPGDWSFYSDEFESEPT